MTGSDVITLRVDCATCGRPYVVTLPLRTEPHDGFLAVVVDTDHLTLAVRAHNRQHT